MAAGFAGYNRENLSDDLAEFVNNPVRVLHGEVPYRDFWLLHPPGEVFVPAAIYQLGFGVNAVLAFNVVISVFVGLAAFWLGRMLSGSNIEGTLAAVLVFFAGEPAEYVGHAYLHFYFLWLLLAAIALAEYLQSHRRASLFFAGAAVGLAFLFRSYLTGAAAAALSATVVLEARSRNCPWSGVIGRLAICGSGCLAALAGALPWLLEPLPHMWQAVVVDSVAHAVTRRVAYGHSIAEAWVEFKEALEQLSNTPGRPGAYFWTAVEASELLKTGWLHVLPFLALPIWVCRARPQPATRGRSDWMLFFLLLWGSLTFIRPLTRGAHPDQLSQATSPLFLALIVVLRSLVARWRATKSIAIGFAACLLIATAVGVGQAAVSATMKQFALRRRSADSVGAPYGTVVFTRPWQANELRELLEVVLENTSESDRIFVIPWQAPAIYALTRRHNSTYYDSTIDLFYRPDEERQRRVCAALLENDTRLIVARADMPGPGWDEITWKSQLPLVNDFIEDRFERIQDAGRFSVWRPRRQPLRTGSAAENADAPGP
jgi:hypothetical protein